MKFITSFLFPQPKKYSLQIVNENLMDFFRGEFVAFAADSGGWKYVISLRDIDYGKIYFCRMDVELDEALTFVANTFDEFIDGMFVNEEWK